MVNAYSIYEITLQFRFELHFLNQRKREEVVHLVNILYCLILNQIEKQNPFGPNHS
jgi:uncharacterized OsmC-like protein